MKRILAVVMLALMIGACQQKEEPKSPPPQGEVGKLPADPKVLQDIVAKDPGNVRAWIDLGNIMMDSQRFGEAIEAYQKALAIDPKNVDVRVDMGTCYRNSGKPDEALREYDKALEINPGHLMAIRNKGVVFAFDKRDNQAAVKQFEKYLQLAPNAPDAAQIRQQIEQLKGKP
ncbi:MAG: tetratricopeptide repeat protein [Chloroflexota bacterium]